MGMSAFRRLATKIDQHMQQLSAQGVDSAPAIIDRMMGYMPDLHRIWVGTTDDQRIALSNEFPGFYRYALVMEEASEAERNKKSRPYDGMVQCSEQHKLRRAQNLRPWSTSMRRSDALPSVSKNLQIEAGVGLTEFSGVPV